MQIAYINHQNRSGYGKFAESTLPFLRTLVTCLVRGKIMSAADIYVRVPEVGFGPDPHCDVIDFMQRLGFLSTTTQLQPNHYQLILIPSGQLHICKKARFVSFLRNYLLLL